MRTFVAGCLFTAAALTFAAAPADAKGCIKGAIVGGVAGHMMGHGKMGAAAGCAVGHHNASKKDAAGGDQGAQGGGDAGAKK